MSESSPTSSAWPLLCGVMGLLTALSCTYAIILYARLQENVAGQRRLHEDTRMIAEEMKVASQKIADEAYARVKAEARIAALQTQIDELTRALAEAQGKPVAPPTP